MARNGPNHEPAINVPGPVLAVIILYLAVHVGIGVIGGADRLAIVAELAFLPVGGAGGVADLAAGFAGIGWRNAPWTFFTHALVERNLAELVLNGAMIAVFGTVIQRRVGTLRFLALIVALIPTAALIHLAVAWQRPIPLFGAGPITDGLLGASLRFAFAIDEPWRIMEFGRDPRRRKPMPSLATFFADARARIYVLAIVAMILVTTLVPPFAMPGGAIHAASRIAILIIGLFAIAWIDPKDPRAA